MIGARLRKNTTDRLRPSGMARSLFASYNLSISARISFRSWPPPEPLPYSAGVVGALTWPLLALSALAPAIEVSGSETCPRPSEVAARLVDLVSASESDAARLRAFVERVNDNVHVDLLDPTGSRIAEREFPLKGTCAEMARAVAVVIAAWAAALPGAPAGPPETESLPPRSLPPAPPDPLARPTVSPPLVSALAAGMPARARAETRFFVALGVLGSWARGDLAEGAELAVSVRRAPWPAGGRVALATSTPRDQPLGPTPGAVRWSRSVFEVGPSRDLKVGVSRLELHASLAMAVVKVQGVGFASARSANGFDLGAAGGVRWVLPWGNAAPWLGVQVIDWPGNQRLEAGGTSATAELPHIDVQIALGLSLGRFP
jgi:hypothetical protein